MIARKSAIWAVAMRLLLEKYKQPFGDKDLKKSGYTIEDWHRAYAVLKVYWRHNNANQQKSGKGTSKVQNNPTNPIY